MDLIITDSPFYFFRFIFESEPSASAPEPACEHEGQIHRKEMKKSCKIDPGTIRNAQEPKRPKKPVKPKKEDTGP